MVPKLSSLRAVTYLTPGLPLELFELSCDTIAEALDRPVTLDVVEQGAENPFANGEADLGFLCSPTFLRLRAQSPSSIELVPAGFVFDEERSGGAAVYFSDVVVRESHVAECFGDLEGCVWGYSDPLSLSGYFSARQKLHALGDPDPFFAREVDTGSHLRSVQAILQRDIDAAAIDSNVLARLFVEVPELEDQLRVVETLGPFPIQPLVVRSELRDLAGPIANALLACDQDGRRARRLAALGVNGFRAVCVEDYDREQAEMAALGWPAA